MGVPAGILGDKIVGICPAHLMVGPMGAPVKSPPLPFQAPVMLAMLAAGSNEAIGFAMFFAGGVMFQLGSAADLALVADLVPRERHEQS